MAGAARGLVPMSEQLNIFREAARPLLQTEGQWWIVRTAELDPCVDGTLYEASSADEALLMHEACGRPPAVEVVPAPDPPG